MAFGPLLPNKLILIDSDSNLGFHARLNGAGCRQTKLDEALLSSGRVSDALQALLDWLGKAESYLTEDQPVLGDLDTVTMLLEQHKVCAIDVKNVRIKIKNVKKRKNMTKIKKSL